MRQQCAHKTERVYRRRHPEKTPFYSVLFHQFDRFVGEYDLRFEKHYGKWRAVVAYAVAKYLDCGMLKNGFARVRCPNCKNEFLLALMCTPYYTSSEPLELGSLLSATVLVL